MPCERWQSTTQCCSDRLNSHWVEALRRRGSRRSRRTALHSLTSLTEWIRRRICLGRFSLENYLALKLIYGRIFCDHTSSDHSPYVLINILSSLIHRLDCLYCFGSFSVYSFSLTPVLSIQKSLHFNLNNLITKIKIVNTFSSSEFLFSYNFG